MIKLILLLIITNLFSNTIHISPNGSDFPFSNPETLYGDGTEEHPFLTIQKGIDTAVTNDTVLVADGIYQENLVLNKSIILTSYAIYDDLTDWVIYDAAFFQRWVINNTHIENTQIIGDDPDDLMFGSVILITPLAEDCISPEILGFTIMNGTGTEVTRLEDLNGSEEGEIETQIRLGGGILADVSIPFIHYNQIMDNGSTEIFSGGAIQLTSSSEDWSFNDRFENFNPRCDIEEFHISNNLYNNNDALNGNSLANKYYENEFNMSGSVFDILNCGATNNITTSVWVSIEPAATIDYSNSESNFCALTSSSIYIDSNINDFCLEDDCGSEQNPFKTINRALQVIFPTEENPITLFLSSGVYSPNTGELFPIVLNSNITIQGEGEDFTFIDAQNVDSVIEINGENISMYDVTISGGLNDNEIGAGGINVIGSEINNIEINACTISNNYGTDIGGIYLENCTENENNPSLIFNDIEVINNESLNGASGFSVGDGYANCDLLLKESTFSNNSGKMAIDLNRANTLIQEINISHNLNNFTFQSEVSIGPEYSAGLVADLDFTTFDPLYPSNIYMNEGLFFGRDIYISCTNDTPVYLDTFSVLVETPLLFDVRRGYSGNASSLSSGGTVLVDQSKRFPVDILMGSIIKNSSDGSDAIITSNTETEVYSSPLSGGDNNDWDNGDFYEIDLFDKCDSDIIIESGLLAQSSDTIFVAPFGDNSNDGLSPSNPVATIEMAHKKVFYEEGEDRPVVFLAPGTYSTAFTGERFPVILTDNVIVSGSGYTGENQTIINAMDQSRVGHAHNLNNLLLSNIVLNNGGNISRGGGLKVISSHIDLENVSIKNSTADYGGGLYIEYFSSVTSNNLILQNNYANNDGGGLMLFRTGMQSSGGGNHWGEDVWSVFNNTIVDNNDAPYGGGGIMIRDARADFNDLIVRNNSSTQWGGGAISLHINSKAKINKGLIVNNSVSYGQGNILLEGTGTDKELILINTTIANNTSNNGVTGGGIVNWDGYPILLLNSILQQNSSTSASYGNSQFISPGMDIYHSNTTTPPGVNGNINSTPMFSNTDYELQFNSPCIGVGIPYFEWNENIVLDMGLDEYSGNAPNMGYHQCVLDDCGVCNGNNMSMDCDGACGGSAIVDDCGVCNGNNTSCADVMLSIIQTGDTTFDLIMDNSSDVSGFQIGIIDIPEFYSFSSISSGEELPTDWHVSGADVDNVITLLGFSLSGSVVSPGNGIIATVNLTNQINNDFQTNLCFDYNLIASPDASELIVSVYCSTLFFPFEQQILGDMDNDGVLNVLDIVLLINIILDNQYNINGDINSDGEINVLDIVLLVNIILTS